MSGRMKFKCPSCISDCIVDLDTGSGVEVPSVCIYYGATCRADWKQIEDTTEGDKMDDIRIPDILVTLEEINQRLAKLEGKEEPQPEPQTYKDEKTGLEWGFPDVEPMTWKEAIKFVREPGPRSSQMSTYGDFGWRLPTIQELFPLLDHTKYNPASNAPIKSRYYWTCNEEPQYKETAFYVSFNIGGVYYEDKDNKNYICLVRNMEGK
jgi:hypothetical protein